VTDTPKVFDTGAGRGAAVRLVTNAVPGPSSRISSATGAVSALVTFRTPLPPFVIARARRVYTYSLIVGIRETHQMLHFCAQHGIGADIGIVAVG
jgi:D-arabinose 1-dehydrogenase-like Zn-dependent alcohol dehydrogenase